MGFFHKRTETGTEKSLYSIGFNKTLLIAGLGNIGEKYGSTRHNLGFMCLDFFADNQEFPAWQDKSDLKCHLTKKTLGDTDVILIKPTTMMNLSGEAVQATANFYKIAPSQITVVHDELDVPFGQIRTRTGGGAAGHNGIKSIIQHIGEDFGRVRIGIDNDRPEQMDAADYVLGRLSQEEQNQLQSLKKECTSILTEYIYSGQLSNETRSFVI